MDTLDLLKTVAAVGGLIISSISLVRVVRADKRAKATENQTKALAEDHAVFKQQLVAILNKPRGGAGGAGGLAGNAGSVTVIDSQIGRVHGGRGGSGGAGGAGGDAGHSQPSKEGTPTIPLPPNSTLPDPA